MALPMHCRWIVLNLWLDGQTRPQIASQFGCSVLEVKDAMEWQASMLGVTRINDYGMRPRGSASLRTANELARRAEAAGLYTPTPAAKAEPDFGPSPSWIRTHRR
jgi:hypothetical protein